MNIYRINSAALARGIGVDASQISRWRTGERVPTKLEDTARDLAAFLAGTALLEHDRVQLELLTRGACQNPVETEAAIYRYLLEEDAPDAGRDCRSSAAVCALLAAFFASAPAGQVGPLNLWPRVKSGRPVELESFFGAEGRRQAVINFSHEALSFGKEIVLLGWHDASLIGGDERFAELWPRALTAMLQEGRTVCLLAPPVLSPPALASLLSLPLMRAGTCKVYTLRHPPPVNLLLVAAGRCAVLSDDENVTLLIRRQTQLFESMAQRLIAESAPLLAVERGARACAQKRLALEDGEGGLYAHHKGIGGLFVPEDVLHNLLSAQMGADEAAVRMELMARRREAFFRWSRREPWVEAMPMAALDAIALNGSCRLSATEFFGEADATLSGDALRRTLLNMREAIVRPAGKLILAPVQDELPVDFAYKPGLGALFDSGQAETVFLGEPALLSGLELWFENLFVSQKEALLHIDEALEGVG